MKSALVYISLGSNLGNRLHYLKSAVQAFRNHPGIDRVRSSQVYESDPVDHSDQPSYLNAVLEIETTLPVRQFFSLCQEIESQNGRIRLQGSRWNPRTLDIDILFWENLIYKEGNLTIPHPEIENRSFVLIPLVELDSELRHPGTGELLINRISVLPDKLSLHPFSDPL